MLGLFPFLGKEATGQVFLLEQEVSLLWFLVFAFYFTSVFYAFRPGPHLDQGHA